MMRQLAAQGFEGLSPDECQEVVDFIAEFSATRELSLRLLEPIVPQGHLRQRSRAWTGGNLSPASSTRSVGLRLRRCRTPGLTTWSACGRSWRTIPTALPSRRQLGAV